MKILFYNQLDTRAIKGLNKFMDFIQNDDFRSADVKKVADNLYRARLDRSNRLLLSIYCYKSEKYALILEYLPNHSYEKSKFLRRGVGIDEQKIPAITHTDIEQAPSLPHINENSRFHYLDKIISFDAEQLSIFEQTLPLVIIGSAGSGKTALLLEKLKSLTGSILYVTESLHLKEHSEKLYSEHPSSKNQITFYSFHEFLEGIEIPPQTRCTKDHFLQWFELHKPSSTIKDAHSLFEEFRGVLTANVTSNIHLSFEEYQKLGIKQTIFPPANRANVFDLFEKYLDYLEENELYDPNIICHEYQGLPKKTFDYVVIDEVQDLTLIQINLILQSSNLPNNFIIAGDANQIVHPNFFSWSNLRALFFSHISIASFNNVTRILSNNYRNSMAVTHLSNQLLKLKRQRFGSIDRESHYLMNSTSEASGKITLLHNTQEICEEINHKTRRSADHAILVLDPIHKATAQQFFDTPLVFSIQECKGLEYENIILFDLISGDLNAYTAICENISSDDLDKPFNYSRNKDKSDKSLEILKFFINALYVACTRAEKNLYIIETQTNNTLLKTIAPTLNISTPSNIQQHTSSEEDWRQEAQRLEKTGNTEHAKTIRESVLNMSTPDWQVYAGSHIGTLYDNAILHGNKKAKLALFEYALVHEDHRARNALMAIQYKPAFNPFKGLDQLNKKYYLAYQLNKLDAIQTLINRWGADYRSPFNQTPLMIAAWLGKPDIAEMLLGAGANPWLVNNKGLLAFQIALEKACLDENYSIHYFSDLYSLLRANKIVLRIDANRYQFQHNELEFFVLHIMIALFYRLLPEQMISGFPGYSATAIAEIVKHLPEDALPPLAKNKTAIASILEDYSHPSKLNPLKKPQLFIATSNNDYMFNPELRLKVENYWFHIYDILWFDDLSIGNPMGNEDIMPQEAFDSMFEEKKANLKHYLGVS
ncbi:MAG: Unknown protein [uncultured Thiotrichaceae bacterium]|uniref:UvrD-like helicase ATP-binding domain-containing protein n=1 Tax=uncultured Thiotrichaceae bacterium TaxID=298394 RepID=A0A6S6TMH9_9GAMM|nr:MAG: Unknown protein [uncultured Thiotrichaceae bacterium]